MYRQMATMAQASITPDFRQALDIHGHFSPQITFNDIVFIDDLAQARNFRFREITHARVRIHIRRFQDLLAGRGPNSINTEGLRP